MINIREPYPSDDKFDSCGSYVVAVLQINDTSTPLCASCLYDLKKSIKQFDNLQLCCGCENLTGYAGYELYDTGGTCEVTGMQMKYFDRCKCDQYKKGDYTWK